MQTLGPIDATLTTRWMGSKTDERRPETTKKVILAQVSMRKGLEMFGQRGVEEMESEMR